MKSLDILKNVLVENTNKRLFLTEISKKLKLKLVQKFKKEKPNLSDEVFDLYIDGFERFKNSLPVDQRDITRYTFDELEHLVDARTARKELKKGKRVKTEYDEEDTNNIIYDEDGLKIIKGPTKDACIKYGYGQATWCISRAGSGNLFYNYRFSNNLTIYFILDESKPKPDIDGGLVILVEPDGDVRLADRTNSGRYSGHQTVSWSEILKKQPKLQGLENLFEPKPLTPEEREEYNRLTRKRVGDNPYEELGKNWDEVEKWMEFNSPTLSDAQYSNLNTNLKKKYIALGFDLTGGQIRNSDEDVIKYYKKKKIEKISNSSLNSLSKEDVALLNHPTMSEYKAKLQPKFLQDLSKSGSKGSEIEINYPEGDSAKYIMLYGFDDVFNHLPTSISKLTINNRSKDEVSLEVPPTLGKFTNLTALQFTNCLKSLPNEIGNLDKLNFLVIPNNPMLDSLPDTLGNLENLHFINLTNTPAKLPQSLASKMTDEGGGFYWVID